MKFERKLSVPGKPVSEQIAWRACEVRFGWAITITAEVPAYWSDTAAQILATKYFRKAGVPRQVAPYMEEGIPDWLRRSTGVNIGKNVLNNYAEDEGLGSETSAKQVFHRLAGALTYHGWKMGLFHDQVNISGMGFGNDEKSAKIFYDELYLILARQLAAPNSPQWFNTGLWWAYGIEGSASGQWAIDYEPTDRWPPEEPNVFETKNAYEYPQPHACFIQPVADDLVNPGGIMDLWQREVRLFKQGSGTGTNFSNIRAKGEKLSGGGISSGLMSFLEIGDRAAGAIKSGGTTRRAAKMVILDADHPEIEDFIEWKVREESKAAAMWLGSKLYDPSQRSEIPLDWFSRVGDHAPTEIFSINYEGEAIRTVGGQNSNNSVRLRDNFMCYIEANGVWELRTRTTNEIIKRLPNRELWGKICRAAWASADPGLQFHDTINKWHTCKADGEIRASNPCSEYMFLDNTACNLASLNLVKFYNLTNLSDPQSHQFNVDLFSHVARLMTVVLDISVSMASFPSREIAIGSYNYRTLGLGYANLGGLLMRMGLPYDSDKGRSVAVSITALMTGVSYQTSMALAKELGTFPRWEANKESMAEVITLHCNATNIELWDDKTSSVALDIWKDLYDGRFLGFRNAQVTLLAPTGTIGLLMDCDTLGVEPDYALVKHKNLAGGGSMALLNQGVPTALFKLGYRVHTINLISAYITQHGTVEGCPDIKSEDFPVFDCANPPSGFSRCIAPMGHVKMVAAVQPFLSGAVSKTINMPNSATIEDVSQVYMESWKLGLKAVALYRDGSKLAQPLQAKQTKKQPQVDTVNEIRKEAGLNPLPAPTIAQIEAQVKTGAPKTEEAVEKIIEHWKERGIIDKDLSKSPVLEVLNHRYAESQRNYEPESTEEKTETETKEEEFWTERDVEKAEGFIDKALEKLVDPPRLRGEREYLPWRRENVYTQKIKIGPTGQSIHLTIGRYPDGRPGEIRLELSRVGTTLDAMTNMMAMMISIGLQYGVPVEEYVRRLHGRKFDPSGLVEGHEKIKWAASIADLIARELGLEFLGRKDMGEVRTESLVEEKIETESLLPTYPMTIQAVRDICPACQEPCLIRSGTCQTCTSCGYNDGCGG